MPAVRYTEWIKRGAEDMNERPTYEEFSTAIEVLRWYRDILDNGERDGWGIDAQMVRCTKTWLENERDDYYK